MNTSFRKRRHKQTGLSRSTRDMHTNYHRNLHQTKRLLIGNITQNQAITTNPNYMPFEIETLISYNARGNSIARDTFEIEYGQYMTSNHFMITQNCVDPRWNVIKTWTLILMHSYPMLVYQLFCPQ